MEPFSEENTEHILCIKQESEFVHAGTEEIPIVKEELVVTDDFIDEFMEVDPELVKVEDLLEIKKELEVEIKEESLPQKKVLSVVRARQNNMHKNNIAGSTKRTRAPNWESAEKALLKDIISEHVQIIECKNTDTNTNNAKSKAWQKIHKRFAELNPKERRLIELKQQWRCIKMDAKKSFSTHRQEVCQTGGGPKPPSSPKEVLDIVEMIPLEFQVDHNDYDDDGKEDIEVTPGCSNQSHDSYLQDTAMARQPTSGCSKQEMQDNCSETHEDMPQKIHNRRPQCFEHDAVKNIELLAEKRSNTLLEQQQEEHEIKMQLYKQELEYKKREHEEKMVILKLKKEYYLLLKNEKLGNKE